MNYEILVNKENPISDELKVEELVSVGKHYSLANLVYTDQDVLLEKTAAIFLKQLLEDANKIDEHVVVVPNSGHRSLEYQERVMDYYIKLEGLEKAKRRVAAPGTSEHHTGLAIDLILFYNGQLLKDLNQALKTIIFIYNNAHKYGFILRYPKDKECITGYPYEPWHFRYVGIKLATYLYENSMTLEEYYLNKRLNNNLGKN